MSAAKLVFVTNKVCPFAHRAWLALNELGLPYEMKETAIKPGEKPEWFTKLYQSAMGANEGSDGKVPVLVDGDFVLCESAVVAEYVSNKHGPSVGRSLLPADPALKAWSAIFGEQYTGRFVQKFYPYLMALTPEAQEKAKGEFLAAVAAVSGALTRFGGPFVCGADVTLADLLLYPFVARVSVLTHYRGLAIPDEPAYAAYHAWVRAIEARPAVQATAVPVDLWIEGYKGYATGAK